MFELCNDVLKARIEDEIKNLTPEEVHEITKDALREYLKNPDVMKNILFENSPYSYSKDKPTQALKEITKKITDNIDDDYFNDIAKGFVHYLKNNYDKIIKNLIEASIIEKLRETVIYSDAFKMNVTEFISRDREMNGN